MSEKRKISVRKIIQVFLTLILSAVCVVAVVKAGNIEGKKKVKSIDIQIVNEKKFHFLNNEDVMNILSADKGADIKKTEVNKLNIHTMETAIRTNPWVADAQVYVDNGNDMHVLVRQRVPVARVFESNGKSYYVDTTLSAVPISEKYVYYTTVITNVPELKDDSAGKIVKGQIVSLVKFIEKDAFWNAQVSQINMSDEHGFELMTVLGAQKVFFGDTTRMKEKFDNLYLFYTNVLNRIGWDKYENIDVRFKGQVVGSPALAWNPHASTRMIDTDQAKAIIDKEVATEKIATADSGVRVNTDKKIETPKTNSIKKK